MAEKLRDLPGEALLNNRCGFYAERVGLTSKAIRFDKKAIELYRALKDRLGEAAALTNYGLACDDDGKFDDARKLFDQALSIQKAISEWHGEARTLNLMGSLLRGLGQEAKGNECCLQALKILATLNDADTEAQTLNNLGVFSEDLGKPDRALDYYRRALSVEDKARDRYNRAQTLNNIGHCELGTGKVASALAHFQQALPLYVEMHDQNGTAAIATNLGSVYYSLGQIEKSLDSLLRAQRIYRSLKDEISEAVVLQSLVAIYISQKQPAKALELGQRVLAIQRRISDLSDEEFSLFNIGAALNDLNKPTAAFESFESALAMAKRMGDRAMEARCLRRIGLILRTLHKDVDARAALRKSLPIQREVQNLSGEAETLENLAEMSAAEDPSAAIWYRKLSVNIYQDLRKNISTLDKKTRDIYKESVAQTYRRLADLLASQGRIVEAEQVLRLLKDDELYDFVRRSDESLAVKKAEYTPEEIARDREYESLTAELAQFAREFRELQQAAKPDTEKIKSLTAKLEDGEARFQAFLDRSIEKARSMEVPENRLERIKDAESIAGTLAVLPEGTVAVYALAAPDALRLLYFAPGISVGRVAKIKAADLNRKVLEFREILTDPISDPRPLGKEFYDLLIKPIEPLLAGSRARRIMWSLDGQLRYIPLGALYDGKSFLVEKYDLSSFTPAGGSALLERESKKSWRGLAVGVSRAHDVAEEDGKMHHFAALTGVPAELDGVVNALPGSVKLLDEGFTLTEFKSALGTHPNLVHLATHFAFHPGDEARSYFLTGDGKPFRVSDARTLSNLSLQGVSLLTLSACETGLGGSDGSEVEGISAILQKKGAEAVIATLWPVADASTAALMAEFYRLRELNPAESKLHALQLAQVELLSGQLAVKSGPTRGSAAASQPTKAKARWPSALPRYAHPYYWAPFVLVGNWK